MERRDFLKAAVTAAVPVAADRILGSFRQRPRPPSRNRPTLRRPPARCSIAPWAAPASRCRCWDWAASTSATQKERKESIRIIRAAIDSGITFMDNCWDYHDGGSEVRMGKALRDGYREKVFLMTKIDGRTRQAAAEQIDESLKRLQTDHIDLMQFHEVIRLEDPDRIFAEAGRCEAVLAAQKAGKIRFIGFTGHKDPLVHLRMLEVAGEARLPLRRGADAAQRHGRPFPQFRPAGAAGAGASEGIGVLGMKPMGSGVILKSKTVTPVECLHYAMSLPTSTVITGIDSMEILKQDLEAVRRLQAA